MTDGRLPTFVIAGFPKCGTTALATYLADHPEVYVPPEIGLYFFAGEDYERRLDWYRSRFPEGAAKQYGESSPGYILSDAAIDRMAERIPDAKIILLVRNPVDRAYSLYWMQRSKFADERAFGEVVAEEMAGPVPSRPHLQLLGGGRYHARIERLLERFPAESLLVLLFDDLVGYPAETFRAACDFLGVDASVVPDELGRVVNATRPVRSERLRRVMLRLRVGKWLPERFALAIDDLNREEGGYPSMDPDVRGRLIEWFADDNARLSSWLSRDLSAWSR